MAPKSRDRYEQVLRQHLTPEFGHGTVGEITRERVERFFGRLRGGSLAYGTVKKVHTTLSSILSTAVSHGSTAVPGHGFRRRGAPTFDEGLAAALAVGCTIRSRLCGAWRDASSFLQSR
jgi:hypothetical protein